MSSGGCECGKIGYETNDAPKVATACHCLECRVAFEAPFAPWFTLPKSSVKWKTEPDLVKKTTIAERGYCSQCLTPVSMQYYLQPEKISLSAVGLGLPISEHIFLREQEQGFHIPDDGAPRYQEFDPPFEKKLKDWQALHRVEKGA